ncbi:hypothetical protein [Brevundimonas lutea]|uniref:hypothetical protein n=1 Tax=Brevundimonas lutea TaxID=2293980 RepID=UPI000F03CA93|nr:hypothetical protein [Brevundimonas lutea]
MAYGLSSIGDLVLSRGAFDFEWSEVLYDAGDAPAPIADGMGAAAPPSLATPFSEWDDFLPNVMPDSADRSSGGGHPTQAANQTETGGAMSAVAGQPDAPLVDIRWTDPFVEADIRPGGEVRMEPMGSLAWKGGGWTPGFNQDGILYWIAPSYTLPDDGF